MRFRWYNVLHPDLKRASTLRREVHALEEGLEAGGLSGGVWNSQEPRQFDNRLHARVSEIMSDEQLRQSLTELRTELSRLEAEEAKVRERLDALIASVETHVDAPADIAHHDSLVQDLSESVLELEVSHPRATTILNQIAAALGNIGTR